MSVATVIRVSCRVCKSDIGEVSPDELAHLVLADPAGPVCFNCEDWKSDLKPQFFWNPMGGDVFCLGGLIFEIRDRSQYVCVAVDTAHTHEGARAQCCLSSSTYLNTDPPIAEDCKACKKSGICAFCHGKGGWVDALGDVTCPVCDGTGDCTVCLGSGTLLKWLTLPSWLVSVRQGG